MVYRKKWWYWMILVYNHWKPFWGVTSCSNSNEDDDTGSHWWASGLGVISLGHILRKKRWHVELCHFVWKWWWKTTKSSGSIIIFPILAMNGGSAQFWTPCASRPCLCDCTHSGTCCWQAGAWNLSAPHHRHIELETRQEVCSNPANWNWSCRRWWCCQQRLRTWSQEQTGTRTSCHPYHHQRSVHMKVWKALHVHRSTRSKRCANPPQTDGQQSDACSTECLAKPLARSLAVPHPHCTSCGSQQEIHCHWLVVLPGIGCCQACLTVSHDPSLLAALMLGGKGVKSNCFVFGNVKC